MRHLLMAAALSTFFLAVSCAEPQRVVTPLKPPAERLECATLGTRPQIPPEYVIDWTRVVTLGQARAEHEAFVTRLRERESQITGYIVSLEGALFVCANNAAWLRDFYEGLPQ